MILLKLNSSSFKGVISVQERRTAYEPKKIIKRIKLAGQISVRWSDGWSGKCKDDVGYHTESEYESKTSGAGVNRIDRIIEVYGT